jgi:GT2 family glycosyltransferase
VSEAPAPAPLPSLSIVLVSWNAARVLSRCLAALDPIEHEVIVVDNASTDESAEVVAREFPRVRLIRNSENRGFAGAVNIGLGACHGELVLLLNCDAIAQAGAIDRMRRVLAARPDCGAAGGALVDEAGTLQHGFHARRFPTLASLLVDLWLIDQLWPNNPVTRRYLALDRTSNAAEPVDVEQPAAACLMIRGDVLKALGGLDEGFYPAWFEDVDLCRRIISAGWRILFIPDARFTHRGGEAMRALGLTRFSRIWYRNLQRYVRKHHGRGSLVACKALVISGMGLRVAAVVVSGRWADAGAYARVMVDALRYWP